MGPRGAPPSLIGAPPSLLSLDLGRGRGFRDDRRDAVGGGGGGVSGGVGGGGGYERDPYAAAAAAAVAAAVAAAGVGVYGDAGGRRSPPLPPPPGEFDEAPLYKSRRLLDAKLARDRYDDLFDESLLDRNVETTAEFYDDDDCGSSVTSSNAIGSVFETVPLHRLNLT